MCVTLQFALDANQFFLGNADFYVWLLFFFFQAEDGIRDWSVTGVQTCALPIYAWEIWQERGPELLWRLAFKKRICRRRHHAGSGHSHARSVPYAWRRFRGGSCFRVQPLLEAGRRRQRVCNLPQSKWDSRVASLHHDAVETFILFGNFFRKRLHRHQRPAYAVRDIWSRSDDYREESNNRSGGNL